MPKNEQASGHKKTKQWKILSKFMMAFSQNIWCVPKHFWNVIWAAQKNREVVGRLKPAISLFFKSPHLIHCFKFSPKCGIVYLHIHNIIVTHNFKSHLKQCATAASSKQHPRIWFEKSTLAFSCNGQRCIEEDLHKFFTAGHYDLSPFEKYFMIFRNIHFFYLSQYSKKLKISHYF